MTLFRAFELRDWGWLSVCVAVLFVLVWIGDQAAAYGEQGKRWTRECLEKGGTILPTSRSTTRYGTQYGGWICAKIEVIDP